MRSGILAPRVLPWLPLVAALLIGCGGNATHNPNGTPPGSPPGDMTLAGPAHDGAASDLGNSDGDLAHGSSSDMATAGGFRPGLQANGSLAFERTVP
jgi:hypothetical protein